MKLKKYLPVILSLSIGILIAVGGIHLLYPSAKPLLQFSKTNQKITQQKEVLSYTAIGDSLTEGVGDATNSGGFVPIIATSLTDKYHLNGVQTENYGASGDRSDQILKRIKQDKELRKSIETADFMTLTVGGNDLIQIVQKELLNNISKQTFIKPTRKYQKHLQEIYTEIRKLNPKAPIYQLGIYNPYYLDFLEITELQDVVDNWNLASEEIVVKDKHAYFVPINDLLYKGSDDGPGIIAEAEATTNTKNDNNLLYEQDHFHPNNLGYQMMAKAVGESMSATKNQWLEQ